MSQVNRLANRCDVCGHEWIPKPDVIYTHCTSGKCRSRKWDKDAVKAWVEQAENDGLLTPKTAASTSPIVRKPDMQALRDICAGKTVSAIDPDDIDIHEYRAQKAEIPICGKDWWEDGTHYQCLMDNGHRDQKHGLRGIVQRLEE